MRRIKLLFWLFVLVVAFGAGLYSQRVPLSKWWATQQAETLPPSVSYEQFQEELVVTEDDLPKVVVEEEVQEEEEVAVEDGQEVLVDEPVAEEPETEVLEPEEEQGDDTQQQSEDDVLPASINLGVPFTSQAPDGVWENPYKEACEEASIYMVHRYYQGALEGQIPPSTADQALTDIVAFEMDLFGYFEDTTAEQTGYLAEMIYGYQFEVLENPSAEDFRRHLAAGRPVIIPAAGRLLGNPYFTAPGPVYHMLVLRGYTASNQFIANDPGTKHGEAFLYDEQTIMNAMHDWNEGDDITQGAKRALVLSL